jgi:hypothetical protein
MSFSDDFNRADENLLASANWTNVGGADAAAFQVFSNIFAHVPTGDTLAVQCPTQGSANHATQVGIGQETSNAWAFFVTVRHTDLNNFWGFYCNTGDGGLALYKRVAGTFTEIGTYDVRPEVIAAFPSLVTVRIEAGSDNVFTVKVAGTARITSSADSFNASEVRQGVAAFVANTSGDVMGFDNFLAEPIALAATAFQWNAFQDNAFQIYGGVAAPVTGSPWHYYAQQSRQAH